MDEDSQTDMDEDSADPLMQYLNGEISFFEWLEIRETDPKEVENTELGAVEGEKDELGEESDNEDEIDITELEISPSLQPDTDMTESSHNVSETDEPVLVQVSRLSRQAPRRMTELLLELPAAKHVQKHGGTSVDEFLEDIPISRKRKHGRPRRNDVPQKLRRQMGQANILCAKGEYEKAKNICVNIIKLAPKCPEPFQTLGMVYEMQDDMKKALQFFLITAYLSKTSDVEEWLKLAGMSLEQNNYKQAMACYNQALKHDPENISLLWDRAALCYQMNDPKKAAEGYEAILKILPPDSPDKLFDLSVELAMIYHENSSLEKAVDVMGFAFEMYPDHSDLRAVNLLAELYITAKQHSLALKNICTLCRITQQSPANDGTSSGSEAKEPLSSFSNLMGYDIELSPQKPKIKSPDTTSAMVNLSHKGTWIIPDNVPIDLRVKAVVCLIHLHCLNPIKTLMATLFQESVEDVGDLYLDIAEAYAETGEHVEALPILDALVSTSKYNQAGVWLKKAQCLMSLGHLEDAIMAYNQVVNLAPNHLEARITLSSLHQQLGRPDQALDILTNRSSEQGFVASLSAVDKSADHNQADDDIEIDQEHPSASIQPQDYRLLFHKCVLLESQSRPVDFVDAGLLLFSMYFKDVYTDNNAPDESDRFLGLKTRKRTTKSKNKSSKEHDDNQRKQRTKSMKKAAKDNEDSVISSSTSKVTDDTGIRVEEWWDMLKKVIHKTSIIKRHKEAEHLIFCALNSSRLTHCTDYQHELEFMSVFALYLSRKYKLAFDYLRQVMLTYPEKTVLWNMLSVIVAKTEDIRHHRYCIRMTAKYPDKLPLVIMNGHNAFSAGSYKFAIAEYVRAFRQKPDEPTISLCLAIQYLHLACQRYPRGRHMALIQGVLFLFQYLTLRGECQEVYYNLGRAFHQLGLTHFAVHYYNKSLETPYHQASTNKDGNPEFDEKHDLHRETAFNLSLIYRASGNNALAKQILYRYVII